MKLNKKMKNIRKIVFLCGIIGFIAFSCEKDDECDNCICDVENPQESLSWLKELIENRTNSFFFEGRNAEIYSFTFNNNEIFEFYVCLGCADVPVVYFDCDGNVLCESGGFDGGDCPEDMFSNQKNKQLIWKNY